MDWLNLEAPASVIKKYTDAGFTLSAYALTPSAPETPEQPFTVRAAIRFNGESLHFTVRFFGTGETEADALAALVVTNPLPAVRLNREVTGGNGSLAKMNNAMSWAVRELKHRLVLFSAFEVVLRTGGKPTVHTQSIATLPGHIRNGICAHARKF